MTAAATRPPARHRPRVAASLAFTLALACGLWAAAPATAAEPASSGEAVAEPDGFRGAPYRAPVPASLAGAVVVDTAAAYRLWEDGAAVFIDVLPRPPRPDLPEGTLWRPPERRDIPGSIWLANTGFEALSPEAEAYFQDGLAAASDGDKAATLVFYCLSDCWMSWNAAKRAVAEGYTAVMWYPEGTDGWEAAGHDLELREPAPGAGAPRP